MRQSSAKQVEHNRESTDRQYALIDKACERGWSKDQVTVIDEDLGLSGADASNRNGLTQLTAQVAMARVGIVLGLEISRLARNKAMKPLEEFGNFKAPAQHLLRVPLGEPRRVSLSNIVWAAHRILALLVVSECVKSPYDAAFVCLGC